MVWSLSERERKSLAYCRRQFLLQTDSWILHEKMTKLHTYLHSYSFRFGGRKKKQVHIHTFFFWVKTLMNHVTGTKWLASRCNSFYMEKYNDFSNKFIYSEKATNFFEINPLLLITVNTVKSKGKILQNFVAFSEYMNFTQSSCPITQ